MKLYYFTNAEYGLSDLREKHLKIARINQLNDPFEFMSADLSNDDLRKGIEALKEYHNGIIGLLCFSKNWDNPVQWAHYADKHKGLCLGFDVASSLCIKVDYKDERLSSVDVISGTDQFKSVLQDEMNTYIGVPASKEEFLVKKNEFIHKIAPRRLREETEADEVGLEFMKKILSTKYSHWHYEQEYRFFPYLSSAKYINSLYYFDFSAELVLREVIIGVNSWLTTNKVKGALGTISAVEVFKARLHDSRFIVEKNLVYKSYKSGSRACLP